MSSDFQATISVLAEKANQYHGKKLTEEATKHFLILPFIAALGYDVFDISEVMPEYTADLGTKQRERIDYAIMQGGVPIILIECKPVSMPLTAKNESQLLRYYHTSEARFAILTNGLTYKFYTDSEKSNVMDIEPFFELELNNPDFSSLFILELFQKNKFCAEKLLEKAIQLKHVTLAKNVVANELQKPSDELVHFFASKMYPKIRFTERVKKELAPVISSAITSVIHARIKQALDTTLDTVSNNEEENLTSAVKSEIVTTQDEIIAFNTIRGLCMAYVAPERIVMRDAKSYCAILFDDNNRMPVARLYFNNLNKLLLGVFDGRTEEKFVIKNVLDVFQYKDHFVRAVSKYLKKR